MSIRMPNWVSFRKLRGPSTYTRPLWALANLTLNLSGVPLGIGNPAPAWLHAPQWPLEGARTPP